jgi:hypothetical protein
MERVEPAVGTAAYRTGSLKPISVVVLFVVFAAATAAAATAATQGELFGENLLIRIPADYELGFEQTTELGQINEFVPRGETVEEWSEMITVQLFPTHNDNERFFAVFEALAAQACSSESTHVVATTKENGYRVKVFQLFCPTNLQTEMGEVTFVKTIEGRDKFYVVQKAWRTERFDPGEVPLTSEEIVEWVGYLRSVSVCDTRMKKRKCPQ